MAGIIKSLNITDAILSGFTVTDIYQVGNSRGTNTCSGEDVELWAS